MNDKDFLQRYSSSLHRNRFYFTCYITKLLFAKLNSFYFLLVNLIIAMFLILEIGYLFPGFFFFLFHLQLTKSTAENLVETTIHLILLEPKT